MRIYQILTVWCLMLTFFSDGSLYAQPTASFNSPDTICADEVLTFNNTSFSASTYHWNFCAPNLDRLPAAENLGSFAGNLDQPVFMDVVFTNGKYYGFVTNYNSGDLIRLDFGNSLRAQPAAVNLGNFSGVIPADGGVGGIQVVQNNGKWYAIIVSGYPPGGISPSLIRVSFGNDITNSNPVANNWGNLGNMYDPKDFVLLQENNSWYGFTVNAETNTVSFFNFSNDFENVPSATNLGNLGTLAYPTGIFATHENNNWKLLITNGYDNTRINGFYTLSELDFGNSLLNIPTGANFGNLGNTLQHPRDITILKNCNASKSFLINGHPFFNAFGKLLPDNSVTSSSRWSSMGNIGNLDFPYSFSRFIESDDGIIGFVVNRDNNSITRIGYYSCNNAAAATSELQNPLPVEYNSPGIYNISLTIDKRLPTEMSYCKEVVVQSCTDSVIITNDTAICANSSIRLAAAGAQTYSWSPAQYLDDATSANPVATISQTTEFKLEAIGAGNEELHDKVTIIVRPIPVFSSSGDQEICEGKTISLAGSGGDNYLWSPANGLSATSGSTITAAPLETTEYEVKISENVCGYDTVIRLSILVNAAPEISVEKSNDITCSVPSAQLRATGAENYTWDPATGLDNPLIASPKVSVAATTVYMVTGSNGPGCTDTASITVQVENTGLPRFVLPNAFTPNEDGKNDCFGIKNWGVNNILQFSIYNRNGLEIFKTTDASRCWDGRYNGVAQPQGGYVYIIKSNTFCGSVNIKGIITLVR